MDSDDRVDGGLADRLVDAVQYSSTSGEVYAGIGNALHQSRALRKKLSPQARGAVHFSDGGEDLRQMLDGFARNHGVERSVSEREPLRVPLYERGQRRPAVGTEYLGRGGMQRGSGKIAAGDAGTGACEFADEPAPPAGHLKNAQVGDAAKVFAHEAVPRAGGVFVLGRRVVKSLTPSVVLSPQAHALSHTPQALPWPFAKPFSFDHPRTHRCKSFPFRRLRFY